MALYAFRTSAEFEVCVVFQSEVVYVWALWPQITSYAWYWPPSYQWAF